MGKQKKKKGCGGCITFLFGTLFGIFLVIGSIVGVGLYAYFGATVNKVTKMFGITPPDLGKFNDMTINEIVTKWGSISNLTLNELEKDYGLDLGKLLNGLEIPDEVKNMKLLSVFSTDGLMGLVGAMKFSMLFGFAPDMFNPSIRDAMKDKQFSLLLNGKMDEMFSGVYIGDFMNFTRSECTVTAITKQNVIKQLAEAGSETEEEPAAHDHTTGCKFEWTNTSSTKVDELTSTLCNLGLDSLLGGSFSADTLMEDITIGSFFDGELTGIFAKLKDTNIKGLLDAVNTIMIGDVLDYALTYTCLDTSAEHTHGVKTCGHEWTAKDGDGNSQPVKGISAILADKTITDLQGSDGIQDVINTVTLEDVMTIDENSPAIVRELKDKKINELSGALDGLTLSEALGIEPYNPERMGVDPQNVEAQYISGYDGTTQEPIYVYGTYKTEDGNVTFEKSNAILNALAGLSISEMSGGALTEKINGLTLADAMSLERYDPVRMGVDPQSVEAKYISGYDGTTNAPIYVFGKYSGEKGSETFEPTNTILGTLSELTIEEMSGGALTDKINGLTLAEAMGLERYDPIRMGVDPSAVLPEYVSNPEDVLLGDAPLYVYGKYSGEAGSETFEPSNAILKSLAELQIDELSGNKLNEQINKLKLSDIITINESSTLVMRLIKDSKVEELSAKIDSLYLAELIGYEIQCGDETDTHIHNNECWKNEAGNSPSGVMKSVVGLTISEIGSGGLEAKINDTFLGDVFNFTLVCTLLDENDENYNSAHKHGAQCWQDADGNEPKGVLGAVAGLSIDGIGKGNNLQNAIDSVKVGDFFTVAPGEKGILALFFNKDPDNANTTIKELPSKMTEMVASATVGELLENNLLTLEDSTKNTLNIIFPPNPLDSDDPAYWQNMTFSVFVNSLIGIIQTSSVFP